MFSFWFFLSRDVFPDWCLESRRYFAAVVSVLAYLLLVKQWMAEWMPEQWMPEWRKRFLLLKIETIFVYRFGNNHNLKNWILAVFCPFKTDLSGNTVWLQALANVNVARFARNVVWYFLLWFSNTVKVWVCVMCTFLLKYPSFNFVFLTQGWSFVLLLYAYMLGCVSLVPAP